MPIAYFTKTKTRCFLTIKDGPGGATLDTITIAGKREAYAYCVAHAIRPWSF